MNIMCVILWLNLSKHVAMSLIQVISTQLENVFPCLNKMNRLNKKVFQCFVYVRHLTKNTKSVKKMQNLKAGSTFQQGREQHTGKFSFSHYNLCMVVTQQQFCLTLSHTLHVCLFVYLGAYLYHQINEPAFIKAKPPLQNILNSQ